MKWINYLIGASFLISCTPLKRSTELKITTSRLDSTRVKNLIYDKVKYVECARVLYLMSQKLIPLEDTIYAYKFDPPDQEKYLKYNDVPFILEELDRGELELNYINKLVRSSLSLSCSLEDENVYYNCLYDLTENDIRLIFGAPTFIRRKNFSPYWLYKFNFGTECPNKSLFKGMGKNQKYQNCSFYFVNFYSSGNVARIMTSLSAHKIMNNAYYFPK